MPNPVADSYWCESGGAIAAGHSLDPKILLVGKYRAEQQRLFIDVPASTDVTEALGYAQTPARSSVPDPKLPFEWSSFGPSHTHVDKYSEWAWVNAGGDWIDRTNTPQATGQPHFSFTANAVSTGSSRYAVDFTAAAQASQAANRWNAYIVSISGGSRSISALQGPAADKPSVSVVYADGDTGVLKCTACVRLTNSTAYGQIGKAKAQINSRVALEFERPTKAVQSAIMWVTVVDHTASPATVSGYLANPPLNTNPVQQGLAANYPLDAGVSAHADVYFAHDYHDGSVRGDWIASTPGLNVFATSSWSPDLFNLGAADASKLPTAYEGTPVQGKWIEKNPIASLTLVDSGYSGEGFSPLKPGLGALKTTTPGYSGVDGGVTGAETGSSLWMLLPASDIGLVDRLFVRYYMRLGEGKPTAVKNMKMARYSSESASAIYTQAIGKCGIGQMHWTNFGGNNNIGGGNIGWTNRLIFAENPLEIEQGGVNIGAHSWDMTGYNMMFGQQGGLGASMYPDQWYCIEIDLKLNTVDPNGVNNLDDAELNVYMDGRLVLSRTNFSYRKLPLDYRALPFGPNYNSTTRTGPTNPSAGLPPFREIGHAGICMNDYNGGVIPADRDRTVFYTGLVVAKSYIGPMATVPSWAPAPGEIKAISLNTRADVDPRNDALANPSYPSAAAWEYAPWSSMTDFAGAVLAEGVGSHGTYMQYGAAGHSAVSAPFWIGFDLSDRLWKRIGNRPLPSDGLRIPRNLSQSAFGTIQTYYPVEQFDATWGDWKGNYSGWPAGFAQPGYNPPEAGHTRNTFFYRPPAKAGNTGGQIVTAWQPTGVNTGTGIRGGFVWDADTALWSRHSNLRPTYGHNGFGTVYFPSLDVAIAHLTESSGYLSTIYMLDCATMTWATRAVNASPSNPYVTYGSSAFAHGNLLIVANNALTAETPPMTLHAIDASAVKNGSGATWVDLIVSAASYPVAANGTTYTVSWALCPENGCYYAVNRQHGSNKLWKLTPPANPLAGVWVITEETMTGTLDARLSSGASGASFDYGRLIWSSYIRAFLWSPDYVSGAMQAIRPNGV